MDIIAEYLPTALTILGGIVAGLVIIAPVTPTKWDDKVLAALQKLITAVKVIRAPK